MHQAVTEITGISAEKLYKRIQDYVDTGVVSIFRRARRYTVARIIKMAGGEERVDQEKVRETENAFNRMRTEVLSRLHQQGVALQNFIINHTYTIDYLLYTQGYFRGPENIGIDYTSPEEAGELSETAEQLESQLALTLSQVDKLRQAKLNAERAEARLAALDEWLSSLIATNILSDLEELTAVCTAFQTLRPEPAALEPPMHQPTR